MTIFFFVVGLEVKRELVQASSAIRRRRCWRCSPRSVVSCCRRAFTWHCSGASLVSADGPSRWPPTSRLSESLPLFGTRVPLGLKILLLSLAIVDDIVAVLIIAFVFTEAIAWSWLAWAAGGFAVIVIFYRIGVRPIVV